MNSEEIKQHLLGIQETLTNHTEFLKTIIRGRRSDKIIELELFVKEKKRASVGDIEEHLRLSRPWTLHNMKKLAKEPNFKFFKGNKRYGAPSVIVYAPRAELEKKIVYLKKLVNEKDFVPISSVMDIFSLTIDEARGIVKAIVKETPDLEEVYDEETGEFKGIRKCSQ